MEIKTFQLRFEKLMLAFYASLKSGSLEGSLEEFLQSSEIFNTSIVQRDDSLPKLTLISEDAVNAFNYYYNNVEVADWGCVRLFSMKDNNRNHDEIFIIKVSTDGDDGWVEAYNLHGLVAAGRTYLELVYWIDNVEELRSYVMNLDDPFPSNFDISATKWDTPLPWY